MNIVVLISGNGSNLQAIIDACEAKKIKGTLRAVFSNKADAFGLERAREAGVPAKALTADRFDSRDAFDRELIREIDAYAPDVVVLAGFMRILSPAFCRALPRASAEYSPFPAAKISGVAYPSPGAGKRR
nr:phosphoribosylglycinamidine myltransferase [Salmonella sp. NCTC 7297]